MPMRAAQYIERINKIDAIIDNKKEDYSRWLGIAEGMGGFSASEGVQSSKNLQKMPDAVGRYMEIEREIDALKAERENIIKTLEKLPTVEYSLIFKLFVHGYSLKQIAKHFDRSYEWAKKKKRTALEHLQMILDERKE